MNTDPYKRLAERLDALPNGFPPSVDGVELRLLAKLYSPEQAALAAQLRLTPETAAQIADRIGGDSAALSQALKTMARRGLIGVEVGDEGLRFCLMPFVFGIYEMQMSTMDAEFARLFEEYFRQAFERAMAVQPPLHRVIPSVSLNRDTEVSPYESAAEIVGRGKSWGLQACICRKQKALIGEACGHPVDVCLAIGQVPGAFDRLPMFRALTRVQALTILREAAEAGLVHTVSNRQEGISYICNCCTCSCGLLRGMAEFGIANVVARSAFVNRVDAELCIGCELCIDRCQFDALAMDGTVKPAVARVDAARCVGCGVCILACDQSALALVHRPAKEVATPPVNEAEWRVQRAAVRHISLDDVM